MDTRERYQDIIEQVLTPYAERRYSGEDITNEAVFDRERGRFIVASVGWQGYRRVQQNLLHIDLMVTRYGFSAMARKTASRMNWRRQAFLKTILSSPSTALKTAHCSPNMPLPES